MRASTLVIGSWCGNCVHVYEPRTVVTFFDDVRKALASHGISRDHSMMMLGLPRNLEGSWISNWRSKHVAPKRSRTTHRLIGASPSLPRSTPSLGREPSLSVKGNQGESGAREAIPASMVATSALIWVFSHMRWYMFALQLWHAAATRVQNPKGPNLFFTCAITCLL